MIIKEGMANGRLLECKALHDVAQQLEAPADAVALAAIMAQPFEPMVLSGAVSAEQLESNAEALKIHIPKDLLEKLLELRIEPHSYWQERSSLTWN